MVEKKVSWVVEEVRHLCDYCGEESYQTCFVCGKDVCWNCSKEVKLEGNMYAWGDYLQLTVCKFCLSASFTVGGLLDMIAKGIKHIKVRAV